MDPRIVDKVLQDHKDSIISVVFWKRTTGELRHLNGRLGVRKYVSGVGKPYNDTDYGLQTIFDMEIAKTLPEKDRAKAYRSFGVDSVVSIVAGGVMYK